MSAGKLHKKVNVGLVILAVDLILLGLSMIVLPHAEEQEWAQRLARAADSVAGFFARPAEARDVVIISLDSLAKKDAGYEGDFAVDRVDLARVLDALTPASGPRPTAIGVDIDMSVERIGGQLQWAVTGFPNPERRGIKGIPASGHNDQQFFE